MSAAHRRAWTGVFVGAGLLALSCSADRSAMPVDTRADASTNALAESATAALRLVTLHARFGLPAGASGTHFESIVGTDGTNHVSAIPSTESLRGVSRAARVVLPVRASDEVTLEDERTHFSLRFSLEAAREAHVEVAGGMALYRGAVDGADLVHRVHAEGTEDFVAFEARPAREELHYAVDVSLVSGLRLVSNTLEFLDDGGTPVLRVSPPYVLGAKGDRRPAKLEVSGCAYDTNPAGPWGRPITSPGAQRCSVRVGWSGVQYPAIVDPAWGSTGAMITARGDHTASVLPSGKVLIAGGNGDASPILDSAELFDPAAGGGTFAATGSLNTARRHHTASVLLLGKVLVVGGEGLDAPNVLKSAELYDPAAGTFTPTGPMTVERNYHTASVLPSGKVLVTGGCNNGSQGFVCSKDFQSAELFDPAGNAGAGSFTTTGSMGIARVHHTASVLPSGKVVVAGGHNVESGLNLSSAELFDPAGNAGAGTFVSTGTMAKARSGHTASVLLTGKVLVAGASLDASAELFDPAGNAGAGSFAPTGAMTMQRAGQTAALLASGKVLMAGGGVGASVESFDPAANGGAGAFAAEAPMSVPRTGHTMSVVSGGRALVTGGSDGAVMFLASAELFGGALGNSCSTGASCLSGICADGVCCNSACGGGCARCDAPGKVGTCTVDSVGSPGANPVCALPYACDGASPVCPTSCTSDAACAANSYCGRDGTCKARRTQSAACDTKADCKVSGCRECTTGFCVDGFCCDTACNGTCQACAAALKFSSSGNGTCDAAKVGPDPGGTTCAAPVATCDGDHTTTGADGKTQDCSPYKCLDQGTCRLACTSVNDCVAPTICDATGKCVTPAGTGGSGGGCAISAARDCDESTQLAWVVAAGGLVLARRRRRTRSA